MLYCSSRGDYMEDKYYLAVETKPNNYFPIDLLNLSISNNYTTFDLEKLDAFTSKFNTSEIINSIKEANLLDVDNTMSLVIIYSEKNVIRKIPVLTKDNFYDLWSYLKANYEDKNFLNKIYNFLNNKIDSKTLKELKEVTNKEDLLKIINRLPYKIERKLYFYLNEKQI